jgi:hypothetical protein
MRTTRINSVLLITMILMGTQIVPGQSINASPGWDRAMPPGPDARVKITEEYARHVARDTYFWAWPLVNMYTRRLFYAGIKEMAYVVRCHKPPSTPSR